MANQFNALVVASLEIKGASLFILNFETNELELLGQHWPELRSFVGKGPVSADKLLKEVLKGEMVLIADTENEDSRLQYPAEVKREGIRSELVACPSDLGIMSAGC